MGLTEFVPVFPKQDKKSPRQRAFVPNAIKDTYKLHTLFVLGALGQTALFSVLPVRYAVVPAGILALNSVITTILQLLSSKTPFNANAIPTKVSAQLPLSPSDRYPDRPAASPLVVLHLGARFNHPMGLLAPGVKEMGDFFSSMNADLETRAEHYGLLGMSDWRGAESTSNNTMLFIYYFRDLDGLNRFAHDPLHRQAWDWYRKAGYNHLGIFHEAFAVPAASYETIYVNMQPTLLGAAAARCIDEESGAEGWLSPLVRANVSQLRSQFGRMGRAVKQGLEYGDGRSANAAPSIE